VCIGPITAATLNEYGVPADILTEEFTIKSLVEAIVKSKTAF
jgi:uroporphyrinogen-III synthase